MTVYVDQMVSTAYDVGVPETTYSTAEVARLLKVSIKRVLDLLNENRFPGAYKRGREWRIPSEDVEGFTYKQTGRPKKRRGRPPKIVPKRGS